jgi:hypothetical protein
MAEKSRAAREGTAVVEDRIDPAFHRAILKIALELRKMRLDPVQFRRYLGENGARNMGLLLATARAVGH